MHTAEYGVRDGHRGDEPGSAVIGGAVVAGKGVLESVVPSRNRSSAKNRGDFTCSLSGLCKPRERAVSCVSTHPRGYWIVSRASD